MSNLEPPTLELVQETKLWRLLPGCDAGSRLEASGVLAHDGHFHVIFDNVSTIASIDANFAVTPDNCMVGRPDGVCGFEDITYNDRLQRYYTLVEAMPHPDGGFRPQIEEYTGGFDYLETCWVNVAFEQENKGLEGIVYLSRGNSDYVLGLCEGNRCQGGAEGRKPGGGRIHVLQKQDGAWRSIATIALPESLDFVDFAAWPSAATTWPSSRRHRPSCGWASSTPNGGKSWMTARFFVFLAARRRAGSSIAPSKASLGWTTRRSWPSRIA